MNHMYRPNEFMPAKNIYIIKQTKHKMIRSTHRSTVLKTSLP